MSYATETHSIIKCKQIPWKIDKCLYYHVQLLESFHANKLWVITYMKVMTESSSDEQMLHKDIGRTVGIESKDIVSSTASNLSMVKTSKVLDDSCNCRTSLGFST